MHKMRCYYKVLDVTRDAESDEIRQSYRQLALQWHPDKHAHDDPQAQQEATTRFREIQEAYEVLSDINERTWYDAHRNAILRGQDPSSCSHDDDSPEEPEDIQQLWSYFSTSNYSNDDEFFEYYNNVFRQISQNEPDGGQSTFPFGQYDSKIEEINDFYRHFSGFVTTRDFRWAYEYKISRDWRRAERRGAEKVNLKAAEKARKEYIDRVRHLTRVVRARDPRMRRVAEEKERIGKEKERKREEEKVARIERRRAKLEEMANEEDGLDHIVSKSEEVDEAIQIYLREGAHHSGKKNKNKNAKKSNQEYFCAVCNRGFRSEAQWKNHEKSKKHQKMVQDMFDSPIINKGEVDVSKNEKKKKKKTDKLSVDRNEEKEEVEEVFNEIEEVSDDDSDEENGNDEEQLAAFFSSQKRWEPEFQCKGSVNAKNSEESDNDGKEQPKEKKGKKEKRRRAKKVNEPQFKCNVCGTTFQTRNQMFKHIKTLGHERNV